MVFDKSEGHPGGFYRLKAAPPAKKHSVVESATRLAWQEKEAAGIDILAVTGSVAIAGGAVRSRYQLVLLP